MEQIIDFKHANIDIENRFVLADISFEIAKGEFIYLVGKTGSGKSTLLNALYGAQSIENGHAVVCGIDLCQLKTSDIYSLRRKVGVVFQDFQLLPYITVEENLAMILKATGWQKEGLIKRIDEVLLEVGVLQLKTKMPSQLSGGEAQKVVLARALLNNPALILADEPTGNLDPETATEVMQLLLKISREHNTAIIFATHNYGIIAKYPARILKCENSIVTEESGIVVA